MALRTLKNGKAPGAYLIEIIALKAAILNQLVQLFKGYIF